MGRGGGSTLGEKLSKPLSQQGARDPSSGCCSPGQVSWVDLFFCPWVIQRSLCRSPKEECLLQVFP